jgi:hypothetical protein
METHSLLLALLDGVGGHREEEQETPSGQRGNYNGNHRKAEQPTSRTKILYADAVGRNKAGNRGQGKTRTHVAHGEGKKNMRWKITRKYRWEVRPQTLTLM